MTVADRSTSALFKPLRIGKSLLKHRIALAPLTRFRADDNHVPQLPLVADYYSQRGSVPGTLLITEATFISPRASGYPNVPGLWDQAQLKAWKQVTDAVHKKGSFIFVQLWALGRAANPDALKKEFGKDVVSSSDVPFEGGATPRPLTEEEIHEFIADYAKAAKDAIEVAGFDGVEIHGANGYLVDQFTQETANKRTDKWGGSIENRSRFGLEVAKAVVDAVGAERTAIRLSPWSHFQGMRVEDPIPQFSHLVKGLKELKLAYLHLVESRVSGNADVESSDKLDFAIDIWGNTSPVLLAGGFRPESAVETVDKQYKDKDVAIVFGRYFISNPDLPYRVQKGIEFEPYDRNSFYNPKSPEGYVTYPFSKEFQEEFKDQV